MADTPSTTSLLLSHYSPSPSKTMPTTLGTLRAYYLGTTVFQGTLLAGYDASMIGGVIILPSFRASFAYPRTSQTYVSAMVVSLQQLGCFVGCFAVWPLAKRYGRKWVIVWSCVVFIAGVVCQTVDSGALEAFYVGRVVAGLGLGGITVMVPMISAEMSPKGLRGSVGSFHTLMFSTGGFVASWVTWGVARDYGKGEAKQWQIPVGLQILFAGLLAVGMLSLSESVRWLTAVGRHDEAWESLCWVRADNGLEVQEEMAEIRRGVALEQEARKGFQVKEMLDIRSGNLRRTVIAFAIFTAQQAAGATAIGYYGPQYFKLLVGDDDNKALLIRAIRGAVNIVIGVIMPFFIVERFRRRTLLNFGAIGMAFCLISTAVILKTHPVDGHLTAAGVVTVAMIYLFGIVYDVSWGPVVWIYISEMFPTRTREPGMALGVGTMWFFNWLYSYTTPYMIETMGWGTFLLWGLFNIGNGLLSWLALTETRGRSLEDIGQSEWKKEVDQIELESSQEESHIGHSKLR